MIGMTICVFVLLMLDSCFFCSGELEILSIEQGKQGIVMDYLHTVTCILLQLKARQLYASTLYCKACACMAR